MLMALSPHTNGISSLVRGEMLMSPLVFSISEVQLQPFSVIGDGAGTGLGWEVLSLSGGPQQRELGRRRRDSS